MWNTEIKQKNKVPLKGLFLLDRRFLIGAGITSIILSFVVLGFSIYEGMLGGGRVRMIDLPGFHELDLDSAGLYAGIYQHRSSAPFPLKELSQMDVRVMSKEDYEEVPVLMNSSGQIINRLGIQGMPLFNFMVPRSGAYTLSGVYAGGTTGPNVNILLVPQTAGNIKQTLIVGASFFIFFMTLGVLIFVKLERLAPKKKLTAP